MTDYPQIGAGKTVAVIGLSDNPQRDSYQVASYLKDHGYRIIPINPGIGQVFGERAYATLADVPRDIHIDIVDIFRRSEFVPAHVDEVLARGGIDTLWLQEGITHPESEKRAKDAGLEVFSNMCIMKTHRKNS